MTDRKCEVCGVGESIGVASSWLGAFSVAYCKECAESGAEPYWAILTTASMGRLGSFADFDPYFKDTVMATLKVLGKTIEEYWKDVEEAVEQDRLYWEEQALLPTPTHSDYDEELGF